MSCFGDLQLDVTEAASGCDALACLERREYAVVVGHLPLPDLPASTLVSRVRRACAPASIVLVAHPEDAVGLARLVEVGADEYATHPLHRGKFMVSLARALNRRRTVLQANRNALLETLQGGEHLVRGAVEALRRCLEAKDLSCDGHAQGVALVAERLATRYGLDDDEVADVRLAAVLHDLGKVAVDQVILEQPRRLTETEWLEVRSHPVVGAEIVGAIEPLQDVAAAVRHHHERHDGRGYPDGLAGEQIPLASRIIAVADAFDAMVRPRAYRQSEGLAYASGEFRRYAGQQWDPFVVDSLFGCIPDLELARAG
jgi:putative nucleotidyltransferase with HDIG domain